MRLKDKISIFIFLTTILLLLFFERLEYNAVIVPQYVKITVILIFTVVLLFNSFIFRDHTGWNKLDTFNLIISLSFFVIFSLPYFGVLIPSWGFFLFMIIVFAANQGKKKYLDKLYGSDEEDEEDE